MSAKDNENGGLSGSDTGNGVGSDSGSASGGSASGSGGSASGLGGSVDGNSVGVSGSEHGSDSGSAESRINAVVDDGAPNGDTSGSENVVDFPTAGDSGSGSGTGFGSAVRTRLAADNADTGSAASGQTEPDYETAFRLGRKQRGRPRSVNTSTARALSSKETKELVSVFLGSLFDIPAILLKADFWRLSNDENDMLTNALLAWIDSLPKSQGNRMSKWLGENLPVLNVVMVALFIVGERAKRTLEMMKRQKQQGAQNVIEFANNQPQPTSAVQTPLDYAFGNIQ